MSVIIDPEWEFEECPWCKTPGKLHIRPVGHGQVRLYIGCVNNKCPVKPRTISINPIGIGRDSAVMKLWNRWKRDD